METGFRDWSKNANGEQTRNVGSSSLLIELLPPVISIKCAFPSWIVYRSSARKERHRALLRYCVAHPGRTDVGGDARPHEGPDRATVRPPEWIERTPPFCQRRRFPHFAD